MVGSYNRLRVFNWSLRKGFWDELKIKEILNFYIIIFMVWKRDGFRFVVVRGFYFICYIIELYMLKYIFNYVFIF